MTKAKAVKNKAETKTGQFTKGQRVWCWWHNAYLYFSNEGYTNKYDSDNRCLAKKHYYQFYDIADVSVRIHDNMVNELKLC